MGEYLSQMQTNGNVKKKPRINPRAIMRKSNRLAVKVLLNAGFDDIWLKPHTRRHDYVYSSVGGYYTLDLWNMWDGIAIKNGVIVFLAIKTNRWDSDVKIKNWMSTKTGVEAVAINVKNGKIDLRYYWAGL